MSKPADPRQPATGQAELVDRADVSRVVRRVEAAVQRSVEAANLEPRDEGMATLAVEVALAVDVAARRQDPYAMAPVARELAAILTRLQLEPTARDGGTDAEVKALMASMATLDPPPAAPPARRRR